MAALLSLTTGRPPGFSLQSVNRVDELFGTFVADLGEGWPRANIRAKGSRFRRIDFGRGRLQTPTNTTT